MPKTRFSFAVIGLSALGLSALGLPIILSVSLPASAKSDCRNQGSFALWKRQFRRELRGHGVSNTLLRRAYDPISFDPKIIRRDRRQSFFSLSFLEFSERLVTGHRLKSGRRKLDQRARLFRKAEQKYGVPGAVIAAFWALESDFGKGISKQYPVFSSLATLAYDCRRPELFRRELTSAFLIVERGYLPLSRLVGSWAGELGQTQFLPDHYLNFAVDADGDGRRDLMRSDADIIMSTANFIRHLGWRAGEPWLQEVSVPRRMRWREADLAIYHRREQWNTWGVRTRDGRRLRSDDTVAALLLPMGKDGPAFLAYQNFRIYPQWNQSLNYAITAAYLATRLSGAPKYRKGRGPIVNYSYKEIRAMQSLLNRKGYDTGGIDGKHGAKSRAAVKRAQLQYGLPADSYPSRELMARLRR
ncbi:MAG: lytic murein transglycosylase [Hyphomicrobiaceae bacterium]